MPRLDEDPAWTFVVESAAGDTERADESRLALADGRIGTRGSVIADVAAGSPGVFAAGVYRGAGGESDLLPAPLWNRIAWRPSPAARIRRVLDVRAGLMHQRIDDGLGQFEALLFSSVARPGTMALRASVVGVRDEWRTALVAAPGTSPTSGEEDDVTWMRLSGTPGGVSVAAAQRELPGGTSSSTPSQPSSTTRSRRPHRPQSSARQAHARAGPETAAQLPRARRTCGPHRRRGPPGCAVNAATREGERRRHGHPGRQTAEPRSVPERDRRGARHRQVHRQLARPPARGRWNPRRRPSVRRARARLQRRPQHGALRSAHTPRATPRGGRRPVPHPGRQDRSAGVVSFYASARSLQLGNGVEVTALTSVAANLAAIIGGILVFHEPIGPAHTRSAPASSPSASSSPARR